MNKFVKNSLVGLGIAAFAVLPLVSMAATISGAGTAIFSDQTNLYGNAGQTVQVSTNFDIPTGEVLHAIQTDFIGDNLPPVCHVVGIVEGAQNNVSVSFSEALSPNAGNYGFTMNAFTATTVPQAAALNQNAGTACTGTNTSVYNSSNVVHVLPVGSGSGTGTGTDSNSALMAIIAQIQAQINALLHPAVPPVSSVCTAYSQASMGASVGVRNDANVRLQGFLLSQGASIPALAAGASFGFYGSQTLAANSWFQGINHCQ